MIKAVAIGVSAGGIKALLLLLEHLPFDFHLPIFIVQHISPNSENLLASILDQRLRVHVKEAEEKELAVPGTVYIAPANYHLLIEENRTLSLSSDDKENYSRPSIDVLFKSAAFAYEEELMAIVLTGANRDGAKGGAFIKQLGGYVIAQSPKEAEFKEMPRAVIRECRVDEVLYLKDIVKRLLDLYFQFFNSKKNDL